VTQGRGAGRVDQDVDPVAQAQDEVDGVLHLLRDGEIGREDQCLARARVEEAMRYRKA